MVAAQESTAGDPRKERARANRRRMVGAAYRLFCERGYSVPLTAIATEAGVAVQTLYFTFHTKAALLGEVLEFAVLGDGQPLPPHEQPWFDEFAAESSARRALEIVVDSTMEIFARVAPLSGVFRSADPEVAALWAQSEQLRVDGFRKMTATLAQKPGFRPGLASEEANDILFVLLGPETYFAFVLGRGWPPRRWRDWTVGMLDAALLATL